MWARILPNHPLECHQELFDVFTFDKEGSNLLSRLPGFKICCTEFSDCGVGGVCCWEERLLLPALSPRPEELTLACWLAFSFAPWL